MTDKIFTMLKRPSLWQRSKEPFWDDEHISKGMLEAHLNPDLESASRKMDDIERSVKWLSSVIPQNGRILDLGCGPGLYTKRLSDLGYEVTGMDYSKRSLAYAVSQDEKTEYIYKNYLELDECGRFDVVTLIYCDYGALTPDERKTLLDRVFCALKPGGLFILDVFSGKSFERKEETSSWTLYENGGYWSPEPHVCLEAVCLYESNMVSADQYIVITKEKAKEYILWNTAYTRESLTDELSAAGFVLQGLCDDVCGAPYTGEADTLCSVAVKPGK